MEVVRHVIAEPIGNTEGDWSSGPRSSSRLPDLVEGEFEHLTKLEKGRSLDDLVARTELRMQMDALLDPQPPGGRLRRAGGQVVAKLSRADD